MFVFCPLLISREKIPQQVITTSTFLPVDKPLKRRFLFLASIMVVMDYKLSLVDDFRIGDTIRITNKTSTGWKAMINNKREIIFEVNKETSIPLLLDGWMLVDVNDRWEKMWACCKENPFQVGFFKSEQDKIEKLKKNESLYLEGLIQIQELEVVQATNPQNPPVVSFIPLLSILRVDNHFLLPINRSFHFALKARPTISLSLWKMVWPIPLGRSWKHSATKVFLFHIYTFCCNLIIYRRKIVV